ncbi:MAG: cupin domain-containing protein [Thermodesulfobacteriota bacterium]
MPRVFKVDSLPFEKKESPIPEFSWHTSPPLAKLVNSKNLQLDVRSLDPGKFSYPYHFHRNAEELFIIFEGEATLRSPDGFRKITKGDIIFFEEGPSGAHQLYNHADAPCVYLDIRTVTRIDVCEYPDSGKINIVQYMEIFHSSSKVSYFSGEEDVRAKWPKELLKDD